MSRGENIWNGKVALVTGGSSGIGLAIAKQLAAKGAHVWLLARDASKLATALKEVTALSQDEHSCGVVTADVANLDQVVAALKMVTDKAGAPDVLVNSAGIVHPGYFQDIPIEVFRRDVEVNYLGTVYTSRLVIPQMMARRSGVVINICSGAGFFGTFGYTSYSATKFAVAGFTDALRSELKPYGIHISIVYPNDVDTPGLQDELPHRPFEMVAIAGKTKATTASEVADTVLKRAARGDYMIFPGSDAYMWYTLVRLAGSLRYRIVDWIVADAQRKKIS